MGRPRAVWVLLVLNVGIYLLSGVLSILTTGSLLALFNPDARVLALLGMKINVLIAQGEYWRLLTAMFLHGNLVHILFNGFALFALGPEAERIYGTPRFLTIYFLAGIAGSIASYAFSASPSVGASGAIFGLIGCLAMFYYTARRILGDFGRMQLQSMIAIIVINLLLGFSAATVIDNYAHVGGLLGGALVGWLLAPRYNIDTRFYPPVLVRAYPQYGWAVALLMAIGLAWLALVIQPPI